MPDATTSTIQAAATVAAVPQPEGSFVRSSSGCFTESDCAMVVTSVIQDLADQLFFGQKRSYSVVPAGAASSAFTRSAVPGILEASAADTGQGWTREAGSPASSLTAGG